MNAATATSHFLVLGLLYAAAASPLAAQSESIANDYPTLQGPRYTVDLRSGYPEVTWDERPAPERLVVTSDTVGFLVDDAGMPKLLLAWGTRFDNLDAGYTTERYFAWALSQVAKGQPWTERQNNLKGHSADRREGGVTWTGTRTVRLSNPGHELVFVITPDGATATDNGRPVAVTGSNGNYRVYADDYEAGVSLRADGHVYHYYKSLDSSD